MKKILFIPYTYSNGGGAERILSNVINGLAENKDFEISVIEYADFGVKKYIDNPRIKKLKPIVDMNNSSKIERIIKLFLVHFFPYLLRKFYIKEKYDVEISFNYQIPSFLTSNKKDVVNIQWNHGDIYDLKSAPFKRFLQKLSFKKADKIVTISENTKNSVLELFPEYSEKVCTIQNGTDVKALLERADDISNITLNNNSLVFLGRLEPNKNPVKLVNYTSRLIDEGFDVNLYLLGIGEQQKELEKLIASHNLQDRIKLLGYINNPYPIIKQSSAVCMLSESEGFPTVFTEGMALGKPFISSAVGGTQELSNNGSCGVIINDYNDFKQAVSDIIFNPENYEKMQTACKEHIKNFSLENQIREITKLIGNEL